MNELEEKKSYDLAKIAYKAYGETTDFKNFQGNPMPEFDDLPEKIRDAWRNAAAAAGNFTVEFISNAMKKLK